MPGSPRERWREIVSALGLSPHPERGYFVETYRADQRVNALSPRETRERSASTAIYFLITALEPSTYLHRLASDEVFHLYEGGPLEVLRLFPDGSWDVAVLGLDFGAGQRPLLVIPAGTWFGTELTPNATHCLIGCTVAPGFEFEDFELARNGELEARYPEASARIQRMRRVS